MKPRSAALVGLWLAACSQGPEAPQILIQPPPSPIAPGQKVTLAATTEPSSASVSWSLTTASADAGSVSAQGVFISPVPGLFVVSAVAESDGVASEPAFATLQVGLPAGAVTSGTGGGVGTTSGGGTTGQGTSGGGHGSSSSGSTGGASSGGKGTSGGAGATTGGRSTTGGSSGGTSGGTTGGDAGSCLPVESSCALTDTCCGGVCNVFDNFGTCCALNQNACLQDADCCTGVACTKGICCQKKNDICGSGSDCCSNSCDMSDGLPFVCN